MKRKENFIYSMYIGSKLESKKIDEGKNVWPNSIEWKGKEN